MVWSLVVLIHTEAKVTNSSIFTRYFSEPAAQGTSLRPTELQ